MEIQIFKTLHDLNQSFTKWLIDILDEQGEISIALSGGSTPKSLFSYWSKLPKGEIDWNKIKFFWGDERCVPPSDEESNYKMTKKYLFDNIKVPQENIFRIKGENNPANEAMDYGNMLNDEVDVVNGIPVFDIIILGIGNDGHTASIFPYEIGLWDSNDNCVVATHPDTGQKRVSLTGKVINAAHNIAFLVTGTSKSHKIREIIEQPETSEKKYPAALVQPKSGNLFWYLDENAAGELSKNS